MGIGDSSGRGWKYHFMLVMPSFHHLCCRGDWEAPVAVASPLPATNE